MGTSQVTLRGCNILHTVLTMPVRYPVAGQTQEKIQMTHHLKSLGIVLSSFRHQGTISFGKASGNDQ
jgi:hypothetical protein